jgi:hypothetical protein
MEYQHHIPHIGLTCNPRNSEDTFIFNVDPDWGHVPAGALTIVSIIIATAITE